MTTAIDNRTDAERRYDAERDGSLYTTSYVLAPHAPHTGDDLPFGQLADGTPITGVYDADDPNGRSGIVHATVQGWLLTAQDRPNLLTIGTPDRAAFTLGDLTTAQIGAVRALLTTDIPAQLLAAAVAHGRGAIPLAYAAPAVLPLDAQLDLLVPGYESGMLPIGTLPGGETVLRNVGDGAPSAQLTIQRGAIELDIGADGTVFSDCLPDQLCAVDRTDLQALLALDYTALARVADLGPDVEQAKRVWYSLPFAELKHLIASVGFAAWYRDPRRPQMPLPKQVAAAPAVPAPKAAPAPATLLVGYDLPPYRIGYVLGMLVRMVETLDTGRAEQFTTLLHSIASATGATCEARIDQLLDCAAA